MAFSADELRVLRRALAEALHHATPPAAARRPGPVVPAPAREPGGGQEFRRLAAALEEAVRESDRLRAFVLADLARYRDALPGAADGYLERLSQALDGGYRPAAKDLAALRGLGRLPYGSAGPGRRARPAAVLAERIPVPAGGCEAGPPPVAEPPGGPSPDQEPDRRVPTPAELWPPRRPESPGVPEHRTAD